MKANLKSMWERGRQRLAITYLKSWLREERSPEYDRRSATILLGLGYILLKHPRTDDITHTECDYYLERRDKIVEQMGHVITQLNLKSLRKGGCVVGLSKELNPLLKDGVSWTLVVEQR